LSYGRDWKKSKNNIQPQDDEDISDAEATTEDASDLAKPEYATLANAQIKTQTKDLKEISKIKK
jgi:hypothetical protein